MAFRSDLYLVAVAEKLRVGAAVCQQVSITIQLPPNHARALARQIDGGGIKAGVDRMRRDLEQSRALRADLRARLDRIEARDVSFAHALWKCLVASVVVQAALSVAGVL